MICRRVLSLFLILISSPILAESANNIHIKPVSLMDPSGFEKPMASATSLLPADWTSEGGVIWRIQGECSNGHMMQWQAKSADGAATITIYPTVGWRESSMPMQQPQDCMKGSYGSADEFARAMINNTDDGKILDIQRNPSMQQQLAQYYQDLAGDPYMKSWADFASITSEYTHEGEKYQSVVNLFTSHMYMKSGHSFGVGQAMEIMSGGAFMTTEFAAPKQRFSEFLPAFLLFENNYRVNPEWQARINKANRKVAKGNLETSRKISEINSAASQEISAMNIESWRKRQASEDRLSREHTEMTFEQETYAADTPSGQIALPFGYDRAFQLQDGSFYITNDQFFNPQKELGQDAKQLNALP